MKKEAKMKYWCKHYNKRKKQRGDKKETQTFRHGIDHAAYLFGELFLDEDNKNTRQWSKT
jgi:hypothetical protein